MVLDPLYVEITEERVKKSILRLAKWKEGKHAVFIAESYQGNKNSRKAFQLDCTTFLQSFLTTLS